MFQCKIHLKTDLEKYSVRHDTHTFSLKQKKRGVLFYLDLITNEIQFIIEVFFRKYK